MAEKAAHLPLPLHPNAVRWRLAPPGCCGVRHELVAQGAEVESNAAANPPPMTLAAKAARKSLPTGSATPSWPCRVAKEGARREVDKR